MKIGIIGVGKIGGTLARRYAAAGHEVTLANSRGPETVRELAESIGANAATAEGAVAGAHVVLLSIPQMAIPLLSGRLFASSPDDLIVVDTGNYMPFRDPTIEEIENGMVESVWVAQQIGRPVIKVYNSIIAESLQQLDMPTGAPGRIALPVAGDDAGAKQIVMDLVDLSGFDPFDAGPISESWRQQPGMAAYCTDLSLTKLPAALARADRAAGPGIRDAFTKELREGWENATHADRVAAIRRYHQAGAA